MDIKISVNFKDLEALTNQIATIDGAHAIPESADEFSQAIERAYLILQKMAGPYAAQLSIADDAYEIPTPIGAPPVCVGCEE